MSAAQRMTTCLPALLLLDGCMGTHGGAIGRCGVYTLHALHVVLDGTTLGERCSASSGTTGVSGNPVQINFIPTVTANDPVVTIIASFPEAELGIGATITDLAGSAAMTDSFGLRDQAAFTEGSIELVDGDDQGGWKLSWDLVYGDTTSDQAWFTAAGTDWVLIGSAG